VCRNKYTAARKARLKAEAAARQEVAA
jgi:hypothetical protein